MAPSDTTDPDRDTAEGAADQRMVLGGRHGSPTINVSLPFSKLTFGDDPTAVEGVEALAGVVLQLVSQVARLAEKAGEDEVRAEAEQLADQVAVVLSELGEGD